MGIVTQATGAMSRPKVGLVKPDISLLTEEMGRSPNGGGKPADVDGMLIVDGSMSMTDLHDAERAAIQEFKSWALADPILRDHLSLSELVMSSTIFVSPYRPIKFFEPCQACWGATRRTTLSWTRRSPRTCGSRPLARANAIGSTS
jgi:hypothetical protein